ncbi:hypothetical protein GCM10009016_21230 [Halomonas beimenensis]
MLLQLLDRVRLSRASQIGWCRAKHTSNWCQATRDLTRILKMRANAQGHIHPLLDQIHYPVAETHIDLDIRVTLHEARESMCDLQKPERHGCINAEETAWLSVQPTNGTLRLFQLVEQVANSLQIDSTDIGESHAACGAVDKLHPKRLLEVGNVLANRCWGKIQVPRCNSKASQLSHPAKDSHGL